LFESTAKGYIELMTSLFSQKFELVQRFESAKRGKAIRQILNVRGQEFVSTMQARPKCARALDVAWVQSYLAGLPIETPLPTRTLRAVDLFCGSGGLTTGLKQAACSLGMKLDLALASDADLEALEVFRANHGPLLTSGADVQTLVNYHISGRGDDASWSTWPTLIDPHMAGFLADLDVLVAGPPCQGHSNLNNRTRRTDTRNLLYLTTVAFVVATGAKLCIIENVPDVLSDSQEVVRTACALLVKCGYRIDDAILSADEFGVPQRRRRHFLVAVRNSELEFDINGLSQALKVGKVTVRQAIGDLARVRGAGIFDTVGAFSAENIKRINWLFDHNEYDLPDRHRPDCHKNGHTYPSVYGRMKWDEPAQTVTTGFPTPGRGRFIHPGARRTVTPHEAARLQSFPDLYEFSPGGRAASRMQFGKVIGDAVPPLLSRAVAIMGLSLLMGIGEG
jgi:DNA (cytosine-5)-methyltransferase 1